jgi:hypothetical protein
MEQEKILKDLEKFDIDDYLWQENERLDKRIIEYKIKIAALKLSKGK